LQEDVALWVPTGEQHQMINTGDVPLKLATVFVPAYKASDNYKMLVIKPSVWVLGSKSVRVV
jgi:mannose-6-phosphate isomerase-like protein (cupin superfamily)